MNMTQFTVTIPDNKISFFRELISNLSYAKFEETQEFELSDAHKEILNQRLENYKNNPGSYINWEDVKKDIEIRL
ncbi:MAG: addiction module protein [Bacteroidota bacterium]|nr:addiction module protein [Bacteroidota bacterium]